MLKAIVALPTATASAIHPCTVQLMNLFHRIAENNFLAFSFCIHLFERPNFEKIHPLSKAMIENGFSKSAEIYERHHTINELGNHDHIGFNLIENISPITEQTATQATRWAEAISWILCSHSQYLLEDSR